MSVDSLNQYRQVLGIEPLNDAHPVIMAYMWRVLLQLFGFPGIMLVFHQLIYWAAIVLLVVRATDKLYVRMILLILIGFCPPMIIMSLHIWKDVWMMSSLALAAAAMLGYVQRPHWGWVFITLIALFYAVAVRINGFIPGIILLAFLCYLLVSKFHLSKWRTVAMMLTVMLVFSLGYTAMMSWVNNKIHHIYGMGTLIVWDIAAISLAENKDLLPSYLPRLTESKNSLDDLKQVYDPLVNVTSYRIISPYPAEPYQNQLIKDWLALIITYPLPYLQHRTHLFSVLLGATDGPVYQPYHRLGIYKRNNSGLHFISITDEQLKDYLHLFSKLSTSIFYRPWVYFLLAIAVLSISGRRIIKKTGDRKYNLLAATVSLSGIANTGSLFFIATAADYRYITWTIFSAIISAVILLIDITNKRNTQCTQLPK